MKVMLPFRQKLSFRAKIILVIVFMQILITGGAIFTMVEDQHRLIETSAKKNYGGYVRSVTNALQLHLRERDFVWIDQHLKKIAEDKNVIFAVVQDTTGKVVSSTGQSSKVEKSLMEGGFVQARDDRTVTVEEVQSHSLGSLLHEKGHIFHVTAPVEDEKGFLGAVHLGFTTVELNQLVTASSWRGLRLVILVAVLGIILAILVDRRLKGIIAKLIHVAGKMAEGDLSQKVDIHTGDELEKLGNSFNKMAENIGISRRELREWGEKLEKKVAERTEEIEKERHKLDLIVSGIGAGLALIDKDLSVVWVNEYYKEKLSASNILEEKCYRGFWGKGTFYQNCSVLKTFHSGKVEKEKKVAKVGNSLRYYSLTSAPINDEKGNVIQVLELIQDETESTKIEVQLEHASRMASIGKFASGIAHEINNPLASIAACAERLSFILQKDSFVSQDKANKALSYLDRIQDQVYRTGEITGNLLDFVRKKKDVKLQKLDLNSVVVKVLRLLELQTKSQRVRLKRNLTPMLYCLADEHQLEQVLLNLLKNAFDAIGEGGHITVRTWQEKGKVFASVRDNGKGIDSEEFQRIFDPFYTTKDPGKGTGLGLSICYGIMESLGGNVEVESSLGQGSTFTISLPLAKLARRSGSGTA